MYFAPLCTGSDDQPYWAHGRMGVRAYGRSVIYLLDQPYWACVGVCYLSTLLFIYSSVEYSVACIILASYLVTSSDF